MDFQATTAFNSANINIEFNSGLPENVLLTDVDCVEAGLAVVGLVDGGDGDDDADQHRQHPCAHEHHAASPAARGNLYVNNFYVLDFLKLV